MFSRIFIERPRLAVVISIVMVLAGVISLYKLPVNEYPEIAPPSLYVSASYPGAGAEVIAQTVAMPIEDQVNGVDDLLYFTSTSDNMGNYNCNVTFKTGTDTDMALVNLQNAVKRAEVKLPSEVTKQGKNAERIFWQSSPSCPTERPSIPWNSITMWMPISKTPSPVWTGSPLQP